MPVFQKSCPEKLTEFLVGMTKLNLSDKRLSYGTEYERSVAVCLLVYYQQLRKILKAVTSMKSAVSKDKLTISRVRNWLGLGTIHVAMIFGT